MKEIQLKSVFEIVNLFHNGNDDKYLIYEIQRRFETPNEDDITLSELSSLHEQFGISNYTYEGTALAEVREIFRAVPLSGESTFLDVGAGYGSVVLYGAAIFPAVFLAVEAVGKRAEHIGRVSGRLGMPNIHVRHQGADATDHSSASHIFLNNPFLGEYATAYVSRLSREIAKDCTVIAINNIVADFRRSSLFTELENRANIPNYRFGLFAAV